MVTASRREVAIRATREEEVTVTPHHLLLVVGLRAMEVEVGTPATPLTETLITVRVPGTRVKPMMTRSLRKSAVTGGWEQAAHQRDRMKIILETNHPKDPPHPSRDQGRSQSLRRYQRDREGGNRKTHEESSQWSYRRMHNTQAHV